MNFTGKFQFNTSGTLTSVVPEMTRAFFLNPGDPTPTGLRPAQPIPWGVFNLERQPDLVDLITPAGSSGFIHQVTVANAPAVLVNPNIGFLSVRKGIAFTFKDAPPGMLLSPDAGNPGGTYFDYSQDPRTVYTFTSPTDQVPTGMALQLLCDLPGNPVLMPRRNQILKVYPATATQRMTVRVSVTGPFDGGRFQNRYRLEAAVTDSDPQATFTYVWSFPRTHGGHPDGDGRGEDDGGTHTGRQVEMDIHHLDRSHDGILTVTDNHGYSVQTPVSIRIPVERGGR